MTARGDVFWFTGLSGAGKSTLAEAAGERLRRRGISVKILDGDEVRSRLSQPLGFRREDIVANNRAVSELCEEARRSARVVLVPIISPFLAVRDAIREKLSPGFYEIYIEASLDCVMARDVKGLYRKAKAGELNDLIGFRGGEPYEPPLRPNLVINTERTPLPTSADRLEDFIMQTTASQRGEGH